MAVLLFDDFETLDVFGPVEVFGRLTDLYTVQFYSLQGGQISNRHGVSLSTVMLESITYPVDIFLVPGGLGTRKEVGYSSLIEKIKVVCDQSKYVLTVCTGSALLARTGLLDHKKATSNKRAFDWVASNGPHVRWDKTARWVVDGKFYTSSGVSAGIDMSLGFLSDRYGIEFARKVANEIEYNWMEDSANDSFKAV
ncbi:DJ-1/PfpI family protein [Niabella yanshanensis]|uniref:DJ-1/PfpI family protein n=1 Tax=Niabella yanshanensis TaxID=577386 RepID=A0ABZ0W1L3_9BACT|nr:DJ-1/PfpI family protein [Niabella yanshanensis]WQD36804.1 DJ-1/PfpI family protein [Niabella yanshanensis]